MHFLKNSSGKLLGISGRLMGVTPKIETANLVVDLDPSRETYADLASVTSLNNWATTDKSWIGDTGCQPVFRTNILNGKPIVRFDGIDNSLYRNESLILTGGQNTFILVISKPVLKSEVQILFDMGDDNQINRRVGAVLGNTQNIHTARDGSGGSISATEGPVNAYNIIIMRHDGGNSILDVDGVIYTGNISATAGNSGAPFRIGGRFRNNTGGLTGAMPNPWQGDMARFLAYNSALSNTAIADLKANLKSQYGL